MLIGIAVAAFGAPTYCLTNSYGEQTTLTVTGKSGSMYSLSGSINYGMDGGAIWPCTGVYNSSTHELKYIATNPSPDGCTMWATTVTFIYTVTSATTATGTFSNDCGNSGALTASATMGSCGFVPLKLKDGEYGGSGTHKYLRSQMPLPSGINMQEMFKSINISVSPNPAVSSTQISVTLNGATKLSIGIYNQDGTLVKSLVNTIVSAGNHFYTWNLQTAEGNKVKNGYYLVKITTDEATESRNIMVAQ